MTYTYFFRALPDPRKVLPEKMLSVETHREPEYDRRFHCDVYGKAVFLRQLSIAEMQEHDLMPDPPVTTCTRSERGEPHDIQ